MSNKENKDFPVLDKCKIVNFAVSLFANERSSGKKTRDGVLISKQSVEFIDTKAMSKLSNARSQGDNLCRAAGTRLDLFHAWAVPLPKMDDLRAKIGPVVTRFNENKEEFILQYPSFIQKKIEENPTQAEQILAIAPSVEQLDKDLRIIFVSKTLAPDDIEVGAEQQFNYLYEQVAWEIAQDVKKSTRPGDWYSKKTIEVLRRVASKAASFGFLSPSLANIKPAIDKLLAGISPGMDRYDGADAFLIGSMLAFMSDERKIANEGRRIGEAMDITASVPTKTDSPEESKVAKTEETEEIVF